MKTCLTGAELAGTRNSLRAAAPSRQRFLQCFVFFLNLDGKALGALIAWVSVEVHLVPETTEGWQDSQCH